VPSHALHSLIRRLFLRTLCLLAGKADVGPAQVASVLACRCGHVLLGVLEAVKGASEALFDACTTEIQHLLPTSQVGACLGGGSLVVGGGAFQQCGQRRKHTGRRSTKHILLRTV